MVDYSNRFDGQFERSTPFSKLTALIGLAQELSGCKELIIEDDITPRNNGEDDEVNEACMDKTFVSILNGCIVVTTYTSIFELRVPTSDSDVELKLEDLVGVPIYSEILSTTIENIRMENELEVRSDEEETKESQIYSNKSMEYKAACAKLVRSLCRFIQNLSEIVEIPSQRFSELLSEFQDQLVFELLNAINHGKLNNRQNVFPGGINLNGNVLPITTVKTREIKNFDPGVLFIEEASVSQFTEVSDAESEKFDSFTLSLMSENPSDLDIEFLDELNENIDPKEVIHTFTNNALFQRDYNMWGQVRTITIEPATSNVAFSMIHKEVEELAEMIVSTPEESTCEGQLEMILFILDLLE